MGVPKTADGKPIFLPNLFPGNVILYYAGSGDHATNGRGAGDLFQLSSTAQEQKTLEWSFNDWLYIAGGTFCWKGGDFGDWVTLELIAPATPVTAAGGAGNCNVVNGVIIPAPGNGTHNVDLATATPVPAQFMPPDEGDTPQANGYWDWSNPSEGKGIISPSGTPGNAQWHLVASQIVLSRFASKLSLIGDATSEANVPAIKPKKILPHWKFKLTMNNATAKALTLGWYLTTARVATA